MEYFAKSVPNGGSKEEQVTLKQHLDDTVKCAQDFFEKFGHYFTEKEKAIIIEACRVHDLGKANIVFQSKINKELDVIKTQEIPHGFLSAMTTSPEEFKNHIPEADNDDYKAFYTAVYHHHVREDKNGDDIILNLDTEEFDTNDIDINKINETENKIDVEIKELEEELSNTEQNGFSKEDKVLEILKEDFKNPDMFY